MNKSMAGWICTAIWAGATATHADNQATVVISLVASVLALITAWEERNVSANP